MTHSSKPALPRPYTEKNTSQNIVRLDAMTSAVFSGCKVRGSSSVLESDYHCYLKGRPGPWPPGPAAVLSHALGASSRMHGHGGGRERAQGPAHRGGTSDPAPLRTQAWFCALLPQLGQARQTGLLTQSLGSRKGYDTVVV